ncbi:structural maintenance of chromosomes protein 3-like [Anopheles aquasalis]|uniref:structural maintenance of chromosomes protein 3-like n=1 Tax=Anopheles aquasalis TaxID=42839 RepID=UPI00215A7EFF|nr:structural maintenance of chromosomes protein 3-like [Anopheles aquasalis]
MYIKQVIIEGFKSYGQKVVTEPFHKQHNVVIGRNGAGKSNFFSAIELVLSDEYHHIRLDQRLALINKRIGSKSAFVEIVFDEFNSPIQPDKHEVRVRRKIMRNKDQYLLNGNVITRKELISFLESAGLSISSPYYIVKQGRINQLATASPTQLLQVLFDVTEIQLYKECSAQSLKRLESTAEDMEQMRADIEMMKKRREMLNKEKNLLEKFEALNKELRILECVILEKERSELIAENDKVKDGRSAMEEKQQNLENQRQKVQENVSDIKKQLHTIAKELEIEKQRNTELSQEHNALEQKSASLELKLGDILEEQNREKELCDEVNKTLNKLNSQIESREEELHNISMQHDLLSKGETVLNERLAKLQLRRNELIDKLSRKTQFSSLVDRNHWIKAELQAIEKKIRAKKTDLHHTMEKLEQNNTGLQTGNELLEKHSTWFDELKLELDQHKTNLNESIAGRIRLRTVITELLDEESTLMDSLYSSKEKLSIVNGMLRKRIGKAAQIGCESVGKVLEIFRSEGVSKQHIIDGYFGLVVDNVAYDDNISQALEITAGGQLFYHIVENDHISSQLLRKFNELHMPGELHIMPLNRLASSSHRYPDDENCTPLITKLQYDSRFERVFQHICGKTLVCKDLETATQKLKQYNFEYVTYEGDQVRSNGLMKGGHHKQRVPISQLHRDRSNISEKIVSLESRLSSVRSLLADKRKDIDDCEQEILQLEMEIVKPRQQIEATRMKKQTILENLQDINRQIAVNERVINEYRADIELLERREKCLAEEMQDDLAREESSYCDENEIQQLDEDIRELGQQLHGIFSERMKVELRRNKLDNLLRANLKRQRDELRKPVEESVFTERIEKCRQEVNAINAKSLALTEMKEKCEEVIRSKAEKKKKIVQRLKTTVEELKHLEEQLEQNKHALVPQATDKMSLEERIQQNTEMIANFGVLPAIDPEYYNLSLRDLTKRLESTNDRLKRFGQINQKAIEEVAKLSANIAHDEMCLEKLYEIKQELESTFIQLDRHQASCIESSFAKVNHNFGEIFRKIVPGGNGHLTLHTVDDVETGETNGSQCSSDRYTGLSIKVSFVGGDAVAKGMNQLSGGQKTVAAVAFIFAIQKFNPAPFYLFDEIDQALDVQHRAHVAVLINELSSTSQFITTTFRREFLRYAHQFYGVRCRNNTSYIGVVSKDEAEHFINDSANDETVSSSGMQADVN